MRNIIQSISLNVKYYIYLSSGAYRVDTVEGCECRVEIIVYSVYSIDQVRYSHLLYGQGHTAFTVLERERTVDL